jgi:uncharacterized iron-regulated membrane protein
MASIQQFVDRPQTVWLRRAIFQIHLWTGIAMGLYIIAISVSGSALFFRNKINEGVGGRRIVAGSGPLLTRAQLVDAAKRAYPAYTAREVWIGRKPGQEVEILLQRDTKLKDRLFDPYTGRDLGPAVPLRLKALAWLLDLHVNLLAGPTGRILNGIAAIVLTLLAITGAVIWWPGIRNWRRSLKINPRANWKRLNWELHSALGFWSFAFFFMWSFTGIYLVFPAPFDAAINRFAPLEYYRLGSLSPPPLPLANQSEAVTFARVAEEAPDARPRPRRRPKIHYSNGDMVVRTFFGLHFGNFGGLGIRILWAAIGLTPPLLFLTGALMWWNRVLSKEARRLRRGTQIARQLTRELDSRELNPRELNPRSLNPLTKS